jgi:two-component system sensor histidine kinase ChiS
MIRKVGDAFEEAENLSAYVDSVSTSVKRFIPAEFMDYLQKTDVTDLKLGDHVEKAMTIFFSDIRGFTQLSESLTEEQTFAFINSYLARMVPVIKERGGFVDKYVGDAIMALFPDTGGADQALRAALEMQSRVVEYNRHRASVGYRPIEMGIGIHTGVLMLGVVGVQDRMENTVISDAVNLSSRLQAIAKAFNIGVVVSEQSFKSLEDPTLFKYRFIGKVRVKGKAAPVSCFEIFGDTQDEAFDERKMKASTYFEQGMLRYYQKDFLAGFHYFQKALEFLPQDGASKFYMEVCWRKKD